MKLVLFGDSYTAGRVPHTQADGAFKAALVKLGVREDDILDFALSGSTVDQWADRTGELEGSCKDRLDQVVSTPTDHIAVGSLGGNDLFEAIEHYSEVLKQPLKTLEMALERRNQLVEILKRIRFGHRTILMSYPLPRAVTMNLKAATVFEMMRYPLHMALDHAATAAGCECLDLQQVIGFDEHNFDGFDVHPSLTGYDRMAAAVIDQINNPNK